MKLAIGSDHAGFPLKEELKIFLAERGDHFEDFGTFEPDPPVDYPDIALAVAKAVVAGSFKAGILLCGTGQGMAIAANKVPGIRASLCTDVISASFARSHNDANILTMGQRITAPHLAQEILRIWLETSYAGGRHQRRLDKIHEIEQEFCRQKA
ncbi:MAG: ribose 5-phosphate isomerase B [bacterium]